MSKGGELSKISKLTVAGLIPGSGLALLAGQVALPLVTKALQSSQSEMSEAEKKSMAEFEDEARRQKLMLDFYEHQARYLQEVSIAERISNSDSVEIEEFYDVSGKGNAGLKVEESSLTLGLSGEGRRVTKRIIRFSGLKLFGEISDDANG